MNTRGTPSSTDGTTTACGGRALPAPPDGRVAAAFALAFIGYFALLHWLIVGGAWPLLTVAMVCVPWLLAVASLLSQTGRLVACVLVTVAIAVDATARQGVRLGAAVVAHADTLLFIENGVFLVALSTVFAMSLRGSGDALVTGLARVARNGDMPAPVVRYTRRVTVAWALFFAVAALTSTLLFATQSRALWSGFVNLLLWPLGGAMFALEYAIRIRVLRDVPHGSMLAGMDAFRHRGRRSPADVGSGTASDSR